MRIRELILVIALAAAVGTVAGTLAARSVIGYEIGGSRTKEAFIRDFYVTENAVHVSPHSLRRKMDNGDFGFVLVDLRSPQEYAQAHIIGAVNIPAYKDPNTPVYEEKERIIMQFRELPVGKSVIVYCYSTPCMTGRKIGAMLAEAGIFVQHLGIGWNEWRYHWTEWNHEHEWAVTKPEDYIATGTDPGVPERRALPSPCGEGELGC